MTQPSRTLVAVEDNFAEKDSVLRVEWNLGRRCNFDCSYCGASTHDKVSPHLSMDVIEKTLRRLAELSAQHGKSVRIAFTGGEPYLHPDFLRILEMAKSLGVKRMSVTTNGSLKAETYLRSLEYLNQIIVSYHIEYARREVVLHNIEQIHLAVEQRRLQGEHRALHTHLMLLPGAFAEADIVMAHLKARQIPYVVRRIRPQFSPSGDYLRPFNSGLTGLARGGTIAPAIPYYSPEEMRRMEAGF